MCFSCVSLYMYKKHLIADKNILEELVLVWATGILKLWLHEFSGSFAHFFCVWATISAVVCTDSFSLWSSICCSYRSGIVTPESLHICWS